MQSMKETASNIVASAKAGMEKTKATVQEKVEKMSTSDEMEKERATQKKEDKINQAEMHKHEVQENNAAARHGPGTGGFRTGGDSSDFSHGYGTGTGTGRDSSGYSSGARHGAGTGGIASDYPSSGGYSTGTGANMDYTSSGGGGGITGNTGAGATYGGRSDDLLTGGLSTTKPGGYSTGADFEIPGGGIGSIGQGHGQGSAGYSSGGLMGGNEYENTGHAGLGVGGLSSEYGSSGRAGMDNEFGIGGTNTAASGERGGMGSEYGRDSSTIGYDGMDSDEMRGTRGHGYETRGSSRNQGGRSDY